MLTAVSLFTLLSLSAHVLVEARPCLVSDINWNLLAFGFDGKDYNAGTSDSWASGTAKEITATGRPPFDGANTTCYLAQFFNAIYVVNGDKANPSDIYIYDATSSSWSTQSTTVGTFDIAAATMILDHDTNLFYAVVDDEMWALDMGDLTSANSTALTWNDLEALAFTNIPTDYQPTIAIAQNHVHFLGVAQGEVDIFVIHFNYFQPATQSYGTSFPASHGQAPSFFVDGGGVQEQFAYIPDGGSNVYVLNVVTNTTVTLAGPPTQDSDATYYATLDSLLQLASDGTVMYIPVSNTSTTTSTSSASWSKVSNLDSVATVASASSSGTATGGASAAKPTVSSGGSSSSSSSGSSSGSGNGAREQSVAMSGLFVAFIFGSFGILFF